MGVSIKLKQIKYEDFVNYKDPAMFLGFPYCSFKCEKDCGLKVCQNSSLALSPIVEIEVATLVKRFIENPITSCVVCGGLEPLDNWEDLLVFISCLRVVDSDSTVIIYTGYNKDEIVDKVKKLSNFPNIIIKYGRFVPNDLHRYDPVLGVTLMSLNQYAERIS